MSYSSFDFTIADKVAHIAFNRPDKRNSMTLAFWQEMRAVFGEVDRRAEVRAVVISSSGPHFSSGMDLSVFGSLRPEGEIDEGRKRENLRRQILWFQECFSVIERCRAPVLAAIQGGCIGGGADRQASGHHRQHSERGRARRRFRAKLYGGKARRARGADPG
jgi:enoyl-CoA hydratase